MRSEDEKKTVTKSLKMTKNECSIIEEKAKESGKSFSRYVVDTAVSGGGQGFKSPMLHQRRAGARSSR